MISINKESNYKRKKRNIWTKDEDQKLIIAISKFGNKNWELVAQEVGNGRLKSQCRRQTSEKRTR